MKANELRKILESLGMNQSEFAEELAVEQSTISRWLSGEHKIIPAMEKHIRRTAEELLGKAS